MPFLQLTVSCRLLSMYRCACVALVIGVSKYVCVQVGWEGWGGQRSFVAEAPVMLGGTQHMILCA